jgi:hypothetical protein
MTAIQRFAIHGTFMNPHSSGPYVRHEDHLAAMQGRRLAQIEEPAGAAPAAVAGPAREEIAALREEHGITSTGRGIKEFEQVDAFVRAVLQRWGAAPALEAPAAPAGWKLVPEKPTDAMLGAAQKAWLADPLRRSLTLYAAALAAAPQAPAAPVPMAWPVARDELQRWAQFADCACRISNPADVRNNMETLAEQLTKLSAMAPMAVPAAPAVDAAGVLLTVIQRLNQNPYSLTKSECISEVEDMRDAALAAQAKEGGGQ